MKKKRDGPPKITTSAQQMKIESESDDYDYEVPLKDVTNPAIARIIKRIIVQQRHLIGELNRWIPFSNRCSRVIELTMYDRHEVCDNRLQYYIWPDDFDPAVYE